MRLMLTLFGEPTCGTPAALAAIDAFLAERGVTVLDREQLADEAATATLVGPTTGIAEVEPGGSQLRAIWILDAPSRAAAAELLRDAPGDTGTLELRESFTPEDLGAPPPPADAPPPPPPPAVRPGHHRYIGLIRSDRLAESGAPPTQASMDAMDGYLTPLIAAGTFLGGEGLKPSAKGTRIRRSAAQRAVLDGPFTEAKELVGGYGIVQARTLAEAVDLLRPWLRIHREGQGCDAVTIEIRRLR